MSEGKGAIRGLTSPACPKRSAAGCPPRPGVFVADEFVDNLTWPTWGAAYPSPGVAESLFEGRRRHEQVSQELGVATACSVCRLARRRTQIVLHAGRVKVVEQGAMVEQIIALSLL